MAQTKVDKDLHRLFQISLAIKTFDGLLEILAGASLMIFRKAVLQNLFVRMARGELAENPPDKFFVYLRQGFHAMTGGSQSFVGFYVLIHGVLNIFLLVCILKEKLWAYWVAIVCMGCFIIFQVYRLTQHYSLGLIILTCFDAFFIFLTWNEYKLHKRKLHAF